METSANNTSRDRAAVDAAFLILRLVLGVIFTIHGSQKMFGAFDGPGLQGIVGFLGPIGYLVAIGEFFGGLGLIAGFLSRFSAASITVIMVGAIQKVHGPKGFFLPEGYEFNLALIGMALAILIAGPGSFAVSRLLPERMRKFVD